jgi:putative transposase
MLRWHRRLIAEKWNFVRRRPGVPPTRIVLGHAHNQRRDLLHNPRRPGPNLGHRVGRGTIANVLRRNGIAPSPERSKRTTWSAFLKAHRKVLAASDFLTTEVWTTRGLVTHYLLFVISLANRVVHIVGITRRPDEAWMLQAGRNLTDSESGALRGKSRLILDRDTKYTDQFRRLIRASGTTVIRLPPRSPNLNAYAERFVRSIKSECLDRMILIGQASLRLAVAEYMDHYHGERNHQGLDNKPIYGNALVAAQDAPIHRSRRLGGMLNFYYREAA